ncbi:MAG: radical SAM protein, partial [Candidatus Ranarchaeia archaeon]
ENASQKFRNLLATIDSGKRDFHSIPNPRQSYLQLKNDIALRMLSDCQFCERRCRKNRLENEKGFCGLDSRAKISSSFLHLGEEAPLVPSGTIFFTSCTFQCVFCQNFDISMDPGNGIPITQQQLADISERLASKGAKNINYVGGEPTPNLHLIIGSLQYLSVNIAQLWNSNMYCSSETMKLLYDIIDIWLPDFKYGDNQCAMRLSNVPHYFDIVSRNHYNVYHETVKPSTSGMIIRHLVLPGHAECCSIPILKWIRDKIPNVLVNIMDQYRPAFKVLKQKEYHVLKRRISPLEYDKVTKAADQLNLDWRQVS